MKKLVLLVTVMLGVGLGAFGFYFLHWRGNRVVTELHENGQKRLEGTLKDGKRHGFWTFWHENGQKKEEGTWKDGKMDGLQTYWHENGQKWAELTLRDGQVISEKWWNSKGEEVETPIDALK